MSVLYIRDLVVTGRHGVHESEKTKPQRFNITLTATLDLLPAAQSDDLNDTVNWSRLRQAVIKIVQANSFDLMERLADAIATRILREDGRLRQVTVSVEKLDAFNSGVPGVTIEKTAA